MTNVLVTGGAGFIGYHLSNLLLRKGFNVTVLDNFSDYYSVKMKQLNAQELEEAGTKIIHGSILDPESVNKALSNEIEIVFHFAAQPGVRYSTANPEKSLRINIEGTSQVLTICNKKKIKKVVVASSSSVFGLQEYLPIDELHPKNPISYYGVSKLTVEKIVEITRRLYPEIDISIIRPFTVIGARQRPDMAINTFLSSALQGKTINIFGDGTQTRDWTHVDNIVEATYLMGTMPNARNEDFNIGSGIRTSVNDVLKLISDETKTELKIKYVDFDKADVKDTLANITKAEQILKYKPQKSLLIAIRAFIDDYLKNRSTFTQ